MLLHIGAAAFRSLIPQQGSEVTRMGSFQGQGFRHFKVGLAGHTECPARSNDARIGPMIGHLLESWIPGTENKRIPPCQPMSSMFGQALTFNRAVEETPTVAFGDVNDHVIKLI